MPVTTLAGPLRDAVAHAIGNMGDEGLNVERGCTLLSLSITKANYFLLVPPEDCGGSTVGLEGAQEKSRKQEGMGQSTAFEKT